MALAVKSFTACSALLLSLSRPIRAPQRPVQFFRTPSSTRGASFRSLPATPAPEMAGQVKDTISLLPAEAELFGVLLAAVRDAGTGTVLRCAGGWVRDKLLGKDSLDIDIALDNIMGRDFAEKVNAWLLSQGKEVRHAAVIQSNPDQSKHLETARMKINGVWIDLVNLRSETYAEGSRIPTMEFGTPEQDALRRDFTINSMFYNINIGTIEDFTGRGLDDLRAGIIRTPLPPSETFMDDPLRVLRAIRFATRFGFEMEETLVEAAASEQVRSALGQKVSRERVGAELEGMFNGPAPVESMRLLNRLLLFPVVFAAPISTAAKLSSVHGDACVACMAAAHQLLNDQGIELDKEERRYLLLAALLLPLRKCQVADVKSKPQTLPSFIARESIKWRAKDAEMVTLLPEVAADMLAAHRQVQEAGSAKAPEAARITLGLSIRKLKQHWQLGALLAPLLTCQAAAALGVGGGGGSTSGSGSGSGGGATSEAGASSDAKKARNEMYSELLAMVEAFGLSDCWQWKPLLDGKQIMTELKKSGKEVGAMTLAVINWQLCHPSGTKEQCIEYLKQQQQQR